MKRIYELNSNVSYNKFKSCWCYNASINETGDSRCTVAMFGDYKTRKEAETAHAQALRQLNDDYAYILNNRE